ncbi:MAG: hypothetical protein WCY41_02445 [Candidatus Micrarchaeia archaeon]
MQNARVRKWEILRGEKVADGFFSSRASEASAATMKKLQTTFSALEYRNSNTMKNARIGRVGKMGKRILGIIGKESKSAERSR